MMLKKLELSGFKSFAHKTELLFDTPVTSVVGPNGSGKSNIVEAIRFVLGEQSMKSLRGKLGSDLIFKGSKNLSKLSRASVAIIFDNKKRVFKLTNEKESGDDKKIALDFDEIKLSREVFSDGTSRYFVNQSEVRMRDIIEVIASVNLGSSGYHIISQGEADRLLNAPAKDRKEMIEDALGLKIYQYRLRESERKLEKTEENLKQTESLRRELAPHLKFLKKQVEKIEEGRKMQIDLGELYKNYFAREARLLETEAKGFEQERGIIAKELQIIEADLAEHTKKREKNSSTTGDDFRVLENSLSNVARTKEDLSRKIGRMEGMIEAEERKASTASEAGEVSISFVEVEKFATDLVGELTSALAHEDIHDIKDNIIAIKSSVEDFVDERKSTASPKKSSEEELKKLRKMSEEFLAELKEIEKKEGQLRAELLQKREMIAESADVVREEERVFFELRSKKEHLLSQRELLDVREEGVTKAKSIFEDELKEARALLGQDSLPREFKNGEEVSREEQEILHKQIERIKIKLEDSGAAGGADVLKEFDETEKRDLFLAGQVEDLDKSMSSLTTVIEELKTRLEKEFTVGIHKINDQFEKFFSLMFGGGKAKLALVEIKKRPKKLIDEEGHLMEVTEEEEEGRDIGVEIDVSLPRKKVKDLDMLSGGERSLTSIALLFALSQVNPPPFLVLDETDAALDEANSQRYGNMVEDLSKLSQLILVTHNRETMSRAQVLYGVTLGADGASKLLSVRFEEAVAIAK